VVSSVSEGVLRGLGILGGTVVVAMGVWTVVTARRPAPESAEVAPSVDLWRGVIVNALSPHPWIFWIGVGAPLLVSAWRSAPGRGIAFLAGFYLLLVGSKVVIAGAVHTAGRRLGTTTRARLLAVGGGLLVVGGALLLVEALTGRL
jgi:threonine/homoserine/homoserine lactone efflux protein